MVCGFRAKTGRIRRRCFRKIAHQTSLIDITVFPIGRGVPLSDAQLKYACLDVTHLRQSMSFSPAKIERRAVPLGEEELEISDQPRHLRHGPRTKLATVKTGDQFAKSFWR